jgi:hypothetical protein
LLLLQTVAPAQSVGSIYDKVMGTENPSVSLLFTRVLASKNSSVRGLRIPSITNENIVPLTYVLRELSSCYARIH